MSLRNLFNINLALPAHAVMKDGEASAPVTLVGVINAKQAAITFGGAPVVVTVMWKVLGAAIPELAGSKLCALVLSIFVGIVIYGFSEQPSGTTRERVLGYLYAFINSFAIAAAVLGIDATFNSAALTPAGQ